MKLTTKLKIAKHKKSCPFVFRLKAKVYPAFTEYRCDFENKLICTEHRVNTRLAASSRYGVVKI